MKTIVILFTLIASHVVMAEDMQKYLSETQELAREGNHKEALERHIWFHDHALEHDRSMYGVRLSFALGSWKRLADEYPPAMKALKEIRDKNTKDLEAGKGDVHLFHDVMALNRTLEDDAKTIQLFVTIEKSDPKKAKKCWRMAKDVVFDAKRYDIARRYVGDVVGDFDQVEKSYQRNIEMYDNPDMGGESFKKYNENHLVKEALQLIEVSIAIGKRDDALTIQKRALALVKDERLEKVMPSVPLSK